MEMPSTKSRCQDLLIKIIKNVKKINYLNAMSNGVINKKKYLAVIRENQIGKFISHAY